MTRKLWKPAALGLFCALAAGLQAGPLTEAQVTKIINDVRVIDPARGSHPAKLKDTIKDDLALRTGVKSRSELLFQDQTLTRLGPETSFSFKAGTRDLTLGEGTMLLQVPKNRGGARIRTAAVTASITGTTVMIEHRPNQSLKLLVLEGSMRVSLKGRFGDSLLLLPGKMVIMPPNAKRIPEPVSVDLAKVVKTSALVKMGKSSEAPLPSMPLIAAAIASQQKERAGRTLIDTNLRIAGSGTEVILDRENAERTVGSEAAPGPAPATSATPAPAPTPEPVPAIPGYAAATDDDDDDDESDSGHDISLGDDRTGDINLTSPIDISRNGGHGKIKIKSRGTIAVRTTLKSSGSAAPEPSRRGGRIEIESTKRDGVAIHIRDSAQLLSLLDAAAAGPGGSIRLSSSGGTIQVSDSTLRADRGKIDLRNTGQSGVITLQNATLAANIIKVQAFGRDGVLNVGGGTLSADSTLFLYASGSSGTINFTDDVTLSGQSAKFIYGNTVTIRDGKTVTVLGPAPASVFTNNPNYTGHGGNNSTTGTFGGTGAVTRGTIGQPGG